MDTIIRNRLTNALSDAVNGECYPCTIVSDRYTGAYSGGDFVAFNLDFYNVPKEIEGDDTVCVNFWGAHSQLDTPIGKGNSPDAAYSDLIKNIITYCEHHLNS